MHEHTLCSSSKCSCWVISVFLKKMKRFVKSVSAQVKHGIKNVPRRPARSAEQSNLLSISYPLNKFAIHWMNYSHKCVLNAGSREVERKDPNNFAANRSRAHCFYYCNWNGFLRKWYFWKCRCCKSERRRTWIPP